MLPLKCSPSPPPKDDQKIRLLGDHEDRVLESFSAGLVSCPHPCSSRNVASAAAGYDPSGYRACFQLSFVQLPGEFREARGFTGDKQRQHRLWLVCAVRSPRTPGWHGVSLRRVCPRAVPAAAELSGSPAPDWFRQKRI